MKKKIWHGLSYLFVALLCISISAGQILEYFSTAIDSALGTTSSAIVSNGDELYTFYMPDEAYLNEDGSGNSAALIQAAIELDRQVEAEGIVLLKNENNVLPLASGANVTLLGMRSYVTLLGASTGNTVKGAYISLYDALCANKTDFNNSTNGIGKTYTTMTDFSFEGAGYYVNPTMKDVYEKLNETIGLTVVDGPSGKYDPKEPALKDLNACGIAYMDSIYEYNDAAIIVVGRPATEGSDYNVGEAGVAEGTGASDPLGLTTNEREIINFACENFEQVIVLVNTASAMEIAELKNNEKIDAIAWIGFPGNYGTLGIGDVLTGKVSPSGAMSNIYVADNESAPAVQNVGTYNFTNQEEIKRSTSGHYLIEAEGIYTGYRYYETRYYDAIVHPESNANSNVGAYASGENWNYNDEVVYGFGYGLSYTTFAQTIDSVTVHKGEHELTMDFEVTVENIGDTYAGKSIVQIYGQAPYENGMVEKSAVQLLGYSKTKTLAPGEKENLIITIDMQNIASYDETHDNGDGTFGTYILDAGNYYFAVGNGAHDALNHIMAAQNYTVEDGMDYIGNADKSYIYSDIAELDDITFSVSKSGVAISNQLEFADWNKYEDVESEVVYLSRSDWEGTYPKSYENMTASPSMLSDLEGLYYKVATDDDTSDINWEKINGEHTYAFYEMMEIDYDDERWEAILAQMSLEEAILFHMFNGPCLPGIDSISFMSVDCIENSGNGVALTLAGTKDIEAPWAIKENDNNAEWSGLVLASTQVLASAFNSELAYETGKFVGNEALFMGISILWGPGGNLMRTPYNGRNGEYCSEDPVLSGGTVMDYTMGAYEKGLITATKHFAFNDQESGRSGIATFMSEQKARENELRGFQIPVEASKYDTLYGKDVGMLGMMISFGKIGTQECTASYGLMNSILRQEWGYKGYATSDGGDDLDLFVSTSVSGLTGHDLRGATDSSFALNYKAYQGQADGIKISLENYANDATLQNALKDSAKNVLYTVAHSNMINRYSEDSQRVSVMTIWRKGYIVAISVTGVLTLISVILYLLSGKKKKVK